MVPVLVSTRKAERAPRLQHLTRSKMLELLAGTEYSKHDLEDCCRFSRKRRRTGLPMGVLIVDVRVLELTTGNWGSAHNCDIRVTQELVSDAKGKHEISQAREKLVIFCHDYSMVETGVTTSTEP